MGRPLRSPTQLPLPTGPAPDGNDAAYWEGLRDGRLVLPRCTACGSWRELGRTICADCWCFETEWAEVPAKGQIFTWARSQRDFMDDLDVLAPYDTVLVALDGVPVRLLGLLVDDSAETAIGQRVVGRVEQPLNAAWPVLRWTREVAR